MDEPVVGMDDVRLLLGKDSAKGNDELGIGHRCGRFPTVVPEKSADSLEGALDAVDVYARDHLEFREPSLK